MKTTNYTLIDVVAFVTACFPFIGSFNAEKLKLRQQHFKRKQNE
jgi:hypothetical protein